MQYLQQPESPYEGGLVRQNPELIQEFPEWIFHFVFQLFSKMAPTSSLKLLCIILIFI